MSRPLALSQDQNTPASSSAETVPQTLSLSEALALEYNPELQAYSKEIRIQQARRMQAGLWPNPELEAEYENFGRSGDAGVFEDTDTTLSLGQLILLAGKRSKAAEVADRKTELARWDYEAKRLEVFTQTTSDFVETLAARENLALAEKILELANRVHETVSIQANEGEISPIETNRTRVVLSNTRVALQRAENRLAAAQAKLAARWGETEASFSDLRGDLTRLVPPPPLEQLRQSMTRNPEIARWHTEMAMRRAQVRLEKAKAIPDPTVKGGVRHFEDSGETAFLAILSLPLPLSNRNQGNIAAAEEELDKAESLRESTEVRIQTLLRVAHGNLQTAYQTARIMAEETLPSAESAFQRTEQAYREGQFGLTEVLDTQRTFFATRIEYIEALADYHQAKATLEGLVGEPAGAPSHNEP